MDDECRFCAQDDKHWTDFMDQRDSSPIHDDLAVSLFNEQLRDVDSLADLGWA